jgi:hypothetical protein
MLGHTCRAVLHVQGNLKFFLPPRRKLHGFIESDARFDNPELLISSLRPQWVINRTGGSILAQATSLSFSL